MKKQQYQLMGKRVYPLVFAAVAVVVSVVASSHVYAEESIFTLTAGTGDLRNQQEIILDIANSQVQSSVLEIVHSDGSPLAQPIKEQGGAGQTKLVVSWNTRTVQDGEYAVRYGAKTNGTWTNSVTKQVRVLNDTPLVTLNPSTKDRVISGQVSRSDVDFRITLGGAVINSVVNVASEAEPTGMYAWYATIPATITDGTYNVEVVALRQSGDGNESDKAIQSLSFTAPPPVKPAEPPMIVLPSISLAQEIGVFIAPVIPETAQATLYGVAVDDLTDDAGQPQNQSIEPTVLGVNQSRPLTPVKTIAASDTRELLQATESGWYIFGVAWYWWVVGMMLAAGTAVVGVHTLRYRQRQLV